jgi:hypothetical protein
MTDAHPMTTSQGSLVPYEAEPDARSVSRSEGGVTDLSAPFDKWGEGLNAGFQLLPDVLLKHQHKLGLTATDLVVLINLTMQWWYRDRHPFPKTTTIARRMGASPRTVQRSLNRLEKLGLLQKVRSPLLDQRRAFDPSGLVERLTLLARHDPNYRERSRGRNGEAGVQPQISA